MRRTLVAPGLPEPNFLGSGNLASRQINIALEIEPHKSYPVALLSCLVLYRHHDNIQRLWRGQESRIWQKLKKKTEKTEKEIIQEAKEQEKED